jgi:uncharacterized protein (TIGR02757 family)
VKRAARDQRLRDALERLYARYCDPKWVHPDPLECVLRYTSPEDQEIAGLVAASLAFGGVRQILHSVNIVLSALPRPRHDLLAAPSGHWTSAYAGFRHRFVTGVQLCELLAGARRLLETQGSLGAAFAAQVRRGDADYVPALGRFVEALGGTGGARNFLLPHPLRGSACKRWFMYLRWMVRRDAVDPGCWAGDLDPARLVYPLDTHMFAVARRLRLTRRRTPDLRAALEVTAAMRRIAPADPVRYDFALTRLGIRGDSDAESFFAACGVGRQGG